MGRFINADSLVSTGQGILGNNMFAYCLNNPVVLVDTSGTAAHIGFSADGQLHDSPWKIGSPGGGGAHSGSTVCVGCDPTWQSYKQTEEGNMHMVDVHCVG